MSQGVYKYKENKLGFYNDSDASQALVDVLATGDKQKIEEFVKDKEVPQTSVELLSFMTENNIPFESVSKIDRMSGLERLGRYGNQFAISTKSLIENLPKRDSSSGEIDKSSQRVLGMEILDLEYIFYEYSNTHPSFRYLSNKERGAFVQMKISEFAKNPTKFYPGLKKLLDPSIRSLNSEPPKDMLEGTKLYLFLYSQMFFPIEKEGEYADCETFEFPKEVKSYFFCKDSEFYFNSRLDTADSGEINSPDRTVFHKNGKPILLQKTGGYKTEYGDRGGTNATAINLEPIFVSGILYPPGTLFGVVKKGDPGYVKNTGNQIFDISKIEGLVPLRLSIYSISPDEKQREDAFGVHYKDFKDSTHWHGKEGDIDSFKRVANKILKPIQEVEEMRSRFRRSQSERVEKIFDPEQERQKIRQEIHSRLEILRSSQSEERVVNKISDPVQERQEIRSRLESLLRSQSEI
jgi:hypothetical protein